MIREIAAKSMGAQIKIMSSREAEREVQDCVVTIAGSMKNKQDACGLIVEQIEAFRSGAPVQVYSKPVDRNETRDKAKSRDDEDRHLGKRSEFKKYSRSPTPDK